MTLYICVEFRRMWTNKEVFGGLLELRNLMDSVGNSKQLPKFTKQSPLGSAIPKADVTRQKICPKMREVSLETSSV